jgi:hypothetical protein
MGDEEDASGGGFLAANDTRVDNAKHQKILKYKKSYCPE